MTCIPSDPRFRLLDRFVGWDAKGWDGLAGADECEGLRLAGGGVGLISELLDPFIPPPRLASGCGRCDWVLATRPAPDSRILTLGGCGNVWRPLWPRNCMPLALGHVDAVAVDRHRLAIAGEGRIWVLHLEGGQVIGEAKAGQVCDLAFGPDGTLFAATEGGTAIAAFTQSGWPLGHWPRPLPGGEIERMGFDRAGLLWLVVRHDGERKLFVQVARRDAAFEEAPAERLASAFIRTALIRSDAHGFCLTRGTADSDAAELCFDWYGRAIEAACVAGGGAAHFVLQGQYLTAALDSGIPRCGWHRIRVDAIVPDNCALAIAVATSEAPDPAAQGVNRGVWANLPDAGLPHPDDWQELEAGVTDALIQQPAGRYLFVRVRLQGDGSATPRVRRIHLDFPRTTSADLLPAVYLDDAAGGAFTQRFLSLFDASLDTVAETVRRFPALLHSGAAPPEVLPWIARFLSVSLDGSWSIAARRRVLAGAPELFRKRGTLPGLERAIELAYDTAPTIVEHGWERAWGGVASGSGTPAPTAAKLGATRLFGRSSARFALDRSALGKTPLMSFGDPGEDPHRAGQFRFSVSVPPASGLDRISLLRLIEGQKPAHTLANVQIGGERNFVLGTGVRLGIDTMLRMPAPMALGDPALRLRRGVILAGRPRLGTLLGRTALSSSNAAWSNVR